VSRPADLGHGRRLRWGAAATIVLLALLGCGPAADVRPSPTSGGTGSPPGVTAALPTPSSAPLSTPSSAASSPPPVLFVTDKGGGERLTLLTSRLGQPVVLDAVLLPPGAWRAGAALGSEGTILLAEARRVLVGRLEGGRVIPLWERRIETLELGDTEAPLGPACLAGPSLAAVFADGFFLVRPAGEVQPAVAFGTRGDCAFADASELLYETEATHRLAAQAVGSATVRISSSICAGMAVGGDLVACLDDAGGGATSLGVWVREPVRDGASARGERRFEVLARAGWTIADAALARDGRWLAVVEEPSAPAGGERRLRLFERDGATFAPRAEQPLAPGLLLLGFGGP
jgi:hypothetical protein